MNDTINKLQNLITRYPNAKILCRLNNGTIKKMDSNCDFIGKLVDVQYVKSCFIYNDIYFDDKAKFMRYYEYDNIDALYDKFKYNPLLTVTSSLERYNENSSIRQMLDLHLITIADDSFYSAIMLYFE